MNKSPVDKNYAKKRIGNKKPMTKDEYNSKGTKLLVLLLLVLCATPFINSYIPLIITAVLLFGFIIVSRIKYGYKAIEAKKLTDIDDDDDEFLENTSIGITETFYCSNLNHKS